MKKQIGFKSKAMRALGVSTILSTMVLPTVARAADEPQEAAAPAAEPQAAEEQGLGEIVVTATRTATSIQKVPISMQALSADTLGQRQVKGLTDFASLLPSVTFAGIGPGRNTPYFRGIVPAGGGRESVGYYIDDIPITGTGLPDIMAYDLERIEALSGPQGTLYGAGSLAGTIRFITKKPTTDKFEFGWDAEVNKYGKGDFGGQYQSYINVPIADNLAVRAMGFYRRDGGYIDNTPNNGKFNDGRPSVLTLGDENPNTSFTLDNSSIAQDDYNSIEGYGGRIQVLWQPFDGWDIMPQISAQKQTTNGYFGFDPRVGDLEVHDYDKTSQNDRWYQAALSIHGHIGDFDLVSATGYYQRQIKLLNDYTYYTVTYDGFGPGYENYLQFFSKNGCTGSGASLKCSSLINPTQFYSGLRNEKKFTQEVRLTTPKSWPFDVTIGGFLHHQTNDINNDYGIHGLADIVGYTKSGGGDSNPAGFGIPVSQGGTMVLGSPAVKRDAFYLTEQTNHWKDYAVFAEGHYNITPELKLTGGIRYFWTRYDVTGFAGVAASAQNAPSIYLPTNSVGCPLPLPAERLQCRNINRLDPQSIGRYREQGETHKVALNWQFQPDKMIYANYSTGFRPGGYNRPLRIRATATLPGVVVAAPPFKSEELTNFELGFKGTWNNMFRLNAAIYLEKWNNIQYGVVVAGAQGAGYTGNAGKAEVKGIEYDADLKLGKVTISTSGAFNDGKLKGDFCNFVADRAALTIKQLATCAVGTPVPGTNGQTSSVAAIDGTRLPRQPKFKGTTSVRYDGDWGDKDFYVQGAALYQTGATQDLNVDQNALYGNTPGFVSFDFSAGIKTESWTLDVFLQNAFDKRGQLTKNTFCSIDFCSGSSRTFIIKPQFFGIRWGQKY